jgi:hypothetical protein
MSVSNSQDTPKYVDVLTEDKAISGQKFVCVSFISPEKILKQKQDYFFSQFLKHFDFEKSMEKFQKFIHFLSFKYGFKFEKSMEDFESFIKSEKDDLIQTNICESYKSFIDKNEEELEKEFSKLNNFQTSVRGIKVRGTFSSQEEAEIRCNLLREVDPNHDIYVGPVGVWMPWEPEAYKTGRVEYLEKELNQLMHQKIKNDEISKEEFEKRVADTKKKAIEENIKLAKETGNKLTQNFNTTSSNEVISTSSIRQELFEGDDIITNKQM